MDSGQFIWQEWEPLAEGRRVVLVGYDYDNATYRVVAVNSDGELVTGESLVQQSQTFYINGDAVVNNLVIEGIYFLNDVKITKIGIFAGKSPTGANLQIDQLVGGVAQNKKATLTDGSQYELTNTADLTVTTTDRYGLKITQIGSTAPGSDLQVVIYYEKI